VLYVKELAVKLQGPVEQAEPQRWQDDARAASIMFSMLKLGKQAEVPVIPLYAVSDDPAVSILDLSATLGIDILLLGASHRHGLARVLKGNVVGEVIRSLPENIELLIHG